MWFLQGYVTAQDRLWQMDGLRRIAAGEFAELVGPTALDSDRESRKLRLRRVAEDAYGSMPPNDIAVFAAYARGVNFFVDSHRDRLPLEFALLKYAPRPWSVVDSILIGLHMFRTLTTTWRDEILKRDLLAGGDRSKVEFLFPVRSGGDVQPGSNAWAVAGSRTASGRPLLANDMHLEYSIPGIWYISHLQAPDLNVSGVCLPGLPSVITGHNDRVAWGVTNLHFDVQDLYLERLDDQTGRYLFRGQVEQARAEREVIQVRNAAAVELVNWVTRHGPLFVADGAERMSLRWTASEAGGFQFPFAEINRARNWTEFTAAISRYPGPAQNFVYADIDGNIGYHASGRLPIRKAYRGDLPVDGSSGNFEWEGFIPFTDLPSAYNPSSGIIVTANQNPFPPAGYPYTANGNFAPPYRAQQIRSLLNAKASLRPADMITIQKDVYSPFSDYFVRSLVSAYDKQGSNKSDLQDVISVLRNWNGQMEKDQAAPLIATLAYQHFRRAVGESAVPEKGSLYELQIAPAVIQTLLEQRPRGWFTDYDVALLNSLRDAVEESRRMQGRNARKWRWGVNQELLIAHMVGRQVPLVGQYFNIGPVPMSGSSTTIKQTTRRMGPSMRMAVDLSDLDRSLLNLPIGQSGQILSRHYKDQWNAYYSGHSFPMQFRNIEAKSELQFTPEDSH